MKRLPPPRTLAIAAALTIIVIALAISILERREAHRYTGYAGTPLVPPKAAMDFTLPTGNGSAAHLLDSTVAVTFLFFGYTHCPDACPLALAALGRAYRTLPSALAPRVRIAFVTVDPARDTPSVAEAYVRNFDRHIVAFTGTPAELARVWRAYDVRVDARSREIAHGATIDAIDPSGRIVLVYLSDTPAKDLAADMARFAR